MKILSRMFTCQTVTKLVRLLSSLSYIILIWEGQGEVNFYGDYFIDDYDVLYDLLIYNIDLSRSR